MGVLLFWLMGSLIANGAVLVDRIAVIAGKHVIKASDIDRDLRVTAFINREPLDLTAAAKRKAADRLVDQEIIRDELGVQGYPRASDAEANNLVNQIINDRFQGSSVKFKATLERYGITQNQLHEQLLWQLTVLRYIDQRFRTGILVTPEEVRAYYDQHLAELKREYPRDSSFEVLSDKIKTSIEGERVNHEFESWLEQARKSTRIEFKESAFQ